MTDGSAEAAAARWQRVKVAFAAVLERDPRERTIALDEACGDDPDLRREVVSLLAAYESDGSFLDAPAADLAGMVPPDASTGLRAGEIAGRYRVLAPLGAGGMGEVYLAEDPRLRRRVALKLLPRALSHDADRLRRFEGEARAASALSHPNVCVIHEIGETDDGRTFFAMEHVAGESLRARLSRHAAEGTRIGAGEATDIAIQIATGLAAAHGAGIVHRDIKPENVMVRPDGLVKILDFGLAKLSAPSETTAAEESQSRQMPPTEPGMVMGTVRYLSPEQARGVALDARTDVWSLGVVLYEMLAGRVPFDGQTSADVLVSILEREPRFPSGDDTVVSPELRAVVATMLQKRREDRYASDDDLLAALRRVQSMSPSQHVGATVRAPRRAFRRVLLGAGATAAAAAMLRLVRADERTPVQLPPSAAAHRVAVTTFDNASRDPSLAATGAMLAAYFAAPASSLDGVVIADREATARVEADGGTALEAARRIGATLLVSGGFYVVGDSLQVQLQLTDVATGEVLCAISPRRVPRANATASLAQSRDRMLGGLAIVSDPMFGRAMLPAGEPPTVAAYFSVREGLEIHAALRPPDDREEEMFSALSRFERAVAADTAYLQARLWLASAGLRLNGGEVIADSALAIAGARADRLSPFERAMLDALRADVHGNHEMSARSWRRAAGMSGSWPASWWLANKLRDANRPHEALAVFDSLGTRTPHFLRAVPSIHHYLGHYQDERRAIEAEGARTPSLLQTLGYQEAALQALAATDSASTVVERAEALSSLPAEGGTSVAHLLLRTSWELSAHGDDSAGARLAALALGWCTRRTPRDLENALVGFDCLEVYASTSEWDRLLRGAAKWDRANPRDLSLIGLLGVTAAGQGDRAAAESFSARIESAARRDGSRGLPEWFRARIAAALGDRDVAVALLRDAFARGATWGLRLDLHRDPAFAPLRGYPPFRQLMTPQD